MRFTSPGFIGVAALAVTATAPAATIFEDETAFLANIQAGYYLEDFDDYTFGSYTEDSLDLGEGPWAYTITTEGEGAPGLYSGDGFMSTNSALNRLVVNMTGADVTALGGSFFATDFDGLFIWANITVDLSDGTQVVYYPDPGFTFRGFTSDVPITQITIDASNDPFLAWPSMDHFYVGAMIPAPGALGLLALAAVPPRRRRPC